MFEDIKHHDWFRLLARISPLGHPLTMALWIAAGLFVALIFGIHLFV